MSVVRTLRSHLLSAMLSPRTLQLKRALKEARRRLFRRPRVVSAFLQLDDPYSYLLAHYLPSLRDHYDIDLRLCLSEALGGAYKPEPELLAEYAVVDALRLARELGIPFLDRGSAPPVEHRLSLLASLAALAGSTEFDDALLQSLSAYWRGDSEAASRLSDGAAGNEAAQRLVESTQLVQQRLGHYNSAMLHYEGEWYWGVDRLHYLLERLDDLAAARVETSHPALTALSQTIRASLPVTPPAAARDLPPLELFHSFRSPYSYLALGRTFEIADAFGLQLKVCPVLPMVMRGLKVPHSKLLYIAGDAVREAERRTVPFGKFSDPVGAGVERCMAVYAYAESERRGREFLINAGEAIWAQGIDVATDKGMRKVTGRTGLFWPDVLAAMSNDAWRPEADANRESMMASGSWGVPTIRLGDFVAWGQDRDWLLVRHIEELCDTGDGILV